MTNQTPSPAAALDIAPRLASVGQRVALAVAAVGAGALIVWTAGAGATASARGFPWMLPSAALAVLTIGLAEAIRARQHAGFLSRVLAHALAGATTLIAGLTFSTISPAATLASIDGWPRLKHVRLLYRQRRGRV